MSNTKDQIKVGIIVTVIGGLILAVILAAVKRLSTSLWDDICSTTVSIWKAMTGPVSVPVWLFVVLTLVTLLGCYCFVVLTGTGTRLSELLGLRNRFLRQLLLRRKYVLTFDVKEPNGKKDITFMSNGQIGDGRNPNENSWGVEAGKLVILAQDGVIYSRFRYNRRMDRFEHTNDPDTPSKRNQYIEPKFQRRGA